LDEKEQFRRAFDVLRQGGIVAAPTDTVYGLLAVATDSAAVTRAYEAKRRDPAQPMPLFVGSTEQADIIGEVNEAGALTIVVRKRPSFNTRAAAGQDTVAIRLPADPVLREFALQLGPLTGTSANIAGREECHDAAQVREQLGDLVDVIVDAAPVATGKPSTIVDTTDPAHVRVLREGAITRDRIAAALAGVADVI
jgi:tRNA threonylcarbamoyl adenosine modification protein (Sua5/YciO/YrdC/YwlC family)